MKKLLPAMRVSLGLIMTVVSIILLSDLLGIIPDRDTAVIDGRKKIVETLAVQYSLAARKNDYDSIESSMAMLVERNDEVLSAALRSAAGDLVAVVGEHAEHWDASLGDRSTPVQMQVPIYKNATLEQKWGSVELRFMPTGKVTVFGVSISPLILMTLFVAITGFLVFLVLIKKIFTNIDPSAVVPSRVRKALDTLTEGVLLIDKKGRALFANEVFSSAVGKQESQIIGKKVVDFGWKNHQDELPWMKTMRSGVSTVGEKVELTLPGKDSILFVVNSSPVIDDHDKQQGVMLTFDDVTELESRNSELRGMVKKLKESSEHINQKNEELRILATVDPLTGCLNRRSLFGQFEEKCLDAVKHHAEFSCLMLDIDHFKRVNDNYGHVAGDQVLRVVSAAIKNTLRSNDEVFRYGGEEFCVLLPGADIASANRLGERIRENIEAQVVDDAVEGELIRVTSSVGTSSIRLGAENLPALIETADAALYASKHNGRNRVTTWSAAVEQGAGAQQDGGDEMIGSVLPDRAAFRRELARIITLAQEQDQTAAVLLLDLDTFQRINNVFGYLAGDAVLDAVSQRLTATVRASDSAYQLNDSTPGQMVYGLGGDEFGVLLTGLDSQAGVSTVVERLTESLAAPVMVDDQEIHLTCSIGVSMFPEDAANADKLITCAGVALQQAKRSGNNACRFFYQDLVSVARKDYETEKALHAALDNNEFELYFQPLLDVQSLKVVSMEALIRWYHPERGLIMPADFIPVAEASGLIVGIGQWVINTACQQIRRWLDVGIVLPVAVNLSPVQFRQEDLVEQINTAVSWAKIDPKYLRLEITENTIMGNLDRALETLDTLARFGYKISIDDFGTGYSSLEYLKRFPVDNLKIDRAFIKDVDTDTNDAAIVRAAISMAHSMDLKVVAEGVETEEQLIFLRNLRCDMIQGFLLGVPLPASEAIALIDKERSQAKA